MNNGKEIINTGVAALMNNLESLLEKQIALARGNNLSAVEALTERVSSVAAEIAGSGVCQRGEFAGRRRRLKDLNDKLCLIIAAEKARTGEQLKQIRKGRKMLRAYRGSV